MDIVFKTINREQIEKIKPLWEKLNRLHLVDSIHFQDFYRSFTFEKRTEKFARVDDRDLRIELIEVDGVPVGYCLSTVSDGTGEIDSLFIEEPFQKFGYGSTLVQNSLSWFHERNCSKIMVSVASGHESVFPFYEKFGFHPRLTYLQRDGESSGKDDLRP